MTLQMPETVSTIARGKRFSQQPFSDAELSTLGAYVTEYSERKVREHLESSVPQGWDKVEPIARPDPPHNAVLDVGAHRSTMILRERDSDQVELPDPDPLPPSCPRVTLEPPFEAGWPETLSTGPSNRTAAQGLPGGGFLVCGAAVGEHTSAGFSLPGVPWTYGNYNHATAYLLQTFTVPTPLPATIRVRAWFEGYADFHKLGGASSSFNGWGAGLAECDLMVVLTEPGQTTVFGAEDRIMRYSYQDDSFDGVDLLGKGPEVSLSDVMVETTFTKGRGPQTICIIPVVRVAAYNTGTAPGPLVCAGFQDFGGYVHYHVPYLGGRLRVRAISVQWCARGGVKPPPTI